MRFDVALVPAILLIGAVAINGASLGPAAAADVSPVSAPELHGLFPGQFHVIVHGVLKVHVTANKDGSLFAKQVDKADTGQWEIRSNQLCITFSKWLESRTRCAPVIEEAGWYKTADVVFKKIDGMALATP